MADKYTDAMNLFQSGLSEATKMQVSAAKAKYDNLQQERNTYLTYSGNKDFPKSIRMQFFNQAAALDKQLSPKGSFPAIDQWDDMVGDVLDGFGVIDGDKTLKPEDKLKLKRNLIAAQSRKENDLDQTKFLENVLNHGLGGSSASTANYVKQLYSQNGKTYAVLGRTDGDNQTQVVEVNTPGAPSVSTGPDGKPQLNSDVQPFVKPQVPAEQVEKTGSFESLANVLGRVRGMVTDPETKQLSKKAQGWIGMGNNLLEKGKSFTPATDTDFTNFEQLTQDLENQITYLRSGKQINETEAQRLKAALPSKIKNSKNYIPNLDNFEKTFKNIMSERGTAFDKAGYRNAPAPTATPTNAPTAPKFKVISVRPSGTK